MCSLRFACCTTPHLPSQEVDEAQSPAALILAFPSVVAPLDCVLLCSTFTEAECIPLCKTCRPAVGKEESSASPSGPLQSLLRRLHQPQLQQQLGLVTLTQLAVQQQALSAPDTAAQRYWAGPGSGAHGWAT